MAKFCTGCNEVLWSDCDEYVPCNGGELREATEEEMAAYDE